MSWYDEIEGEFIRSPKQINRANAKHPKAIFTHWLPAELIAIGIYPLTLKARLAAYTYGDESAHKQGMAYIEDTVATIHPLAERVTGKKAQINRQVDQAVNDVTSKYPKTERDSWYKQAEEAKGFTADSTFATPLLDAMANNDATEKAVLAAKIMTNIDVFAAGVGALLRKKKSLIDRIDGGEDPSTVNW